MWDEAKQQRLDRLRVQEAQGTLTEGERTEMEALFAELDAKEAAAMGPALVRMRQQEAALKQEKETLAAEIAQLEHIVRDQEQLLADARSYLAKLRARRAALADQYRRVTGRELTTRP